MQGLRDLLRGCAATRVGGVMPQSGIDGTPSGPADGGAPDGLAVFQKLYASWIINPVAAFSLCLLAQVCQRMRALSHACFTRPVPYRPTSWAPE